MSFFIYDITFLIAFGLFVIIFLYRRRKNLQREGILYLYRTKLGVRFIDYVGKKYKKTLKVLSYFVIFMGYVLMIVMIYLLGQLVYYFLKYPSIVRAIKIPPIMPLIPYLPSIFNISFLPPFYFTYWIIAIAIIAISHEFAHGIFARFNEVKVKSTGFGFLGPFLAAFVEPDEKQMNKKSIPSQLSVLSAGSSANFVMTIIFFIIMYLFFALTFAQAGATFDTYAATAINITAITSVGGYAVENTNAEKISTLIESGEIEESFNIPLDGENLSLIDIQTNEEKYFVDILNLKSQVQAEQEELIVYGDFPAIRNGLRGVIVEFNGVGIKNNEYLIREIGKYNPGSEVEIKTKVDDKILTYNLELDENPTSEGKAFVGIANLRTRRSGLFGFLNKFFNLFKKPSTAYEPKFGSDLIIFIHNLLWWIVIINISVALVNMLPVGIFDGGRVFYLTVLGLTKKEKIAGVAFKIMTYVILLLFLLLMISWFFSFR